MKGAEVPRSIAGLEISRSRSKDLNRPKHPQTTSMPPSTRLYSFVRNLCLLGVVAGCQGLPAEPEATSMGADRVETSTTSPFESIERGLNPQSRIVNGDFENGLVGWSWRQGFQAEHVASAPGTGNGALMLDDTNTTALSWFWSNPVALSGGQRWCFKARTRRDNRYSGLHGHAMIWARFFDHLDAQVWHRVVEDANGRSIDIFTNEDTRPAAQRTWVPVEQEFVVPSGLGIRAIRVVVSAVRSTTGRYWYDDVELVPGYCAPPPPAPSITGPDDAPNGLVTLYFQTSGASEYIVQRATGSGAFEEIQRGASSTLWQDRLLSEGTYRYRVKALNGAAESPWSSTHTVVVEYDLRRLVPDSPAIALNAPRHDNVGTIEGEAAVRGGAGTYRIAIEIPPGRRGMEPEVALAYSSQTEDGIAGVGWTLHPNSKIHRCPQTLAVDDAVRPVDFTARDRLCLDGQRLILMSGNYGVAPSTYRMELDDKSLIRMLRGTISGADATFRIETKDNQLLYFGVDSGTSEAVYTPDGAPAPWAWALRRKNDHQLNSIHYGWQVQNGEHVLYLIRYTGKGLRAGERRVEFTYEDRPDPKSDYRYGFRMPTTRRLTSITTKAPRTVGGTVQVVRKYQLAYEESPATERSLLASVKDCVRQTSCAPGTGFEPTTFSYQGAAVSFERTQLVESTGQERSEHRILSDLDGDGTQDAVHLRWSEPWGGGNPAASRLRLSSGDGGLLPATVMIPGGFYGGQNNLDIDRNGVADLLSAQGPWVEVATWSPEDSVFEVQATDVPGSFVVTEVADFDGDSRPDFLGTVENQSGLVVYLQNEAVLSFRVGTTSAVHLPPETRVHSVQDFDGDGRADLLVDYDGIGQKPPHAEIWFARPQGTGVTFERRSLPELGGPSGHFGETRERRTFVDVNGDGLADIFGQRTELWVNEGGHFVARSVGNASAMSIPDYLRGAVLVADADADGDQELLVPTSIVTHWCWIADPNNPDEERCTNPGASRSLSAHTPSWSFNRAIHRWDVVDFDDDGVGGLIARRRSTDLRAPVYASRVADHFGDGLDDVEFTIARLFGQDEFNTATIRGRYSGGTPALDEGHYVARRRGVKPDLLVESINGLGFTDRLTYRPLSDWSGVPPEAMTDDDCADTAPLYTADRSRALDGQHFYFASKMHVATRRLQSNGNGGFRIHCLRYADAMFNNEGRGFLGFRRIVEEEADSDTSGQPDALNLRTTNEFHQAFPRIDRVTTVRVHLASESNGATPIKQEGNTWHVNCVGGRESPKSRSCFVYRTEHVATSRDPNRRSTVLSQVTTVESYNDTDLPYGNVSSREIISDDSRTRHSEVTTFVYGYEDADAAAGWTNKLVNQAVTSRVLQYKAGLVAPNNLNTIKTVETTFDWYGLDSAHPRLLQTESTQARWADQHRRKVFESYDTYGNPTAVLETALRAPARRTTTTYTLDGYFVATETNSAGHQTERVFDPRTGIELETIDPNGLVTEQRVDDAYYWIEQVDEPGRPPRRKRQQWCTTSGVSCPPAAVYRDVEVQNGQPIRRRYYDVLGRVRKEEVSGFDGNRWVTTVIDFDDRGHRVRQSAPAYAPNGDYFTTWSDFDVLGRPGRKVMDRQGVESTRQSFVTTYQYDGLTTNIELQGLLRASRVVDARDQLLEYVDTMGRRTRFAHDGLGNVVVIEDAEGNQIHRFYDASGRMTWSDDPDQGRWAFGHNGFGDLYRRLDANGQVTTWEYDALGRRTEKRIDGATSSRWRWDPPNALGQLSEETEVGTVVTGFHKAYEYDSLARVVEVTMDMGSNQFRVEMAYDGASGHEKARAYDLSNGGGLEEVVGYHHNAYGYPHRTFNPLDENASHAYRTVADMDARGQVTDALFGNGLRALFSRLGSTGQLSEVCVTAAGQTCAGIQASPALMAIHYEYADPYDNLTAQVDAVRGAREDFAYDNLQRLAAASRSWSGGPPEIINYRYDTLDNLIQKDDYARSGSTNPYVYGSALRNVGNAGPHAVHQVTKADGTVAHFSYDENGNLISGDGRTITYTPSNKPSRIVEGGLITDFHYAPDGNRHTQVSDGVTKYYVGQDAEVISGAGVGRKRIYVGDYAVIEHSGSSRTERFLHRDRLGSVDTVTNELGLTIEQHGFGPFGTPRGAQWEDNGARLASSVTDRGFTDHEHLDAHRLIHMNGRAYDPRLGRFLSVDPLIQTADNRGLNPYSYVQNNPLSGTDPSGYAFQALIGAAAVIADTALTVVSLKEGIETIGNHNADTSFGTAFADYAAVGADAASLALPGIPGVGSLGLKGLRSSKLGRLLGIADDGVDAAKAAKGGAAQSKAVAGSTPSAPTSGAPKTTATQGGGKQSPSEISGTSGGGNACFVAGTLIALATVAVPIESIVVGDRVSTHPGGSSTRVDESWKRIQLAMESTAGPSKPLSISLLRSAQWLEDRNADSIGDRILLSIEELGAQGWARIVRIAPAHIEGGVGRVVLGTVSHFSDDVYKLSFSEGGRQIRGTGAHPLYSLSRNNWVRIRDIRVGERLQTSEGAVTAEALEKIRGVHRVYNLEVERDHEYVIGKIGLRAHNNKVRPGGGEGSSGGGGGDGPFVPEEYWQRDAPTEVTPGTKRLDHRRESKRTGRIEDSRVTYDDYGRQQYRVDKTDHMRPRDHSSPHLHETTYAPKGTQGHNEERGSRTILHNLE